MALTDITRTEVEKAIEECDRLGRVGFLERYGFRRARRFLVAYEGRHYDSKAIIGAAHGYLPGQRPLMAREFSGGAQHAARLLKGLGFDILEDLPVSVLTHDELIDLVTSVKASRSSGAPALYKPITLLWAMGRALRGEPRLLPWSATEEALADLLARHGVRGEKQRPDYPIASLHREGLWTLHDYAGDATTAHGDGKVRRWFAENQPRGGLPEPVYDLFRHSALTRLAVIDELLGTFFDDLDPAPLLADVGLEGVDVGSSPRPTESSPEQWLLTAAEYERGCRLVELREAQTHGERVSRTTHSPKRSQVARYVVLNRSEGRCENPRCTGQPADVTDRKQPILEVDHVVDLALGGRDHPSQMVALCPNCHAVKTRGSTRETLREILLKVAMERHKAMETAKGNPAPPCP
ncbi:HNH endonuclease [Streptomyces shenzhenensis]|uniref:HNH endonuclease n=1 Tax=Streptomyces shenzhenensis TaxID=943815 RepID=UPI00367F63FA